MERSLVENTLSHASVHDNVTQIKITVQTERPVTKITLLNGLPVHLLLNKLSRGLYIMGLTRKQWTCTKLWAVIGSFVSVPLLLPFECLPYRLLLNRSISRYENVIRCVNNKTIILINPAEYRLTAINQDYRDRLVRVLSTIAQESDKYVEPSFPIFRRTRTTVLLNRAEHKPMSSETLIAISLVEGISSPLWEEKRTGGINLNPVKQTDNNHALSQFPHAA